MDASPVASAKATVPESAPNATPLDIRVCRIAPNDDGPIVDRQVVQHLVDHVCHGVVFALGVPSSDEAEVVHERHEARNVLLAFKSQTEAV